MKYIYNIPLLAFIFTLTSVMNAQNPNFYLHENGVTCMCPDADIGETGVVNGVTYTKRTHLQITPQNAATTCTSGITDMSWLFSNTAFNQPIGHWDVSNVTNMGSMFSDATSFNQPIGNWDVSNVTNMGFMFAWASNFNQPIGNWNVSSVINMGYMFLNSSFNQPIGSWNVSNVTNMNYLFEYASSFNQPLDNWNVSNVTLMNGMFSDATSFNQPIENWDVSNVTNMETMFRNATSFNQPLNDWNISNVIQMSRVFRNATSFNQPLNDWDTSGVINFNAMFRNAVSFNQPLNDWDTSGVINFSAMFMGATNFNQPIGNWDVSNVTNMEQMFQNSVYNHPLGNWDVSNVNNMSEMFPNSNFNQPIENWDVSNVTNMENMFYNSVYNHPLSNWNVSNVTNMKQLFQDSPFNQDISSWTFHPDVVFNIPQDWSFFITTQNYNSNYYDALLQSFSDQNLTNKNFRVQGLSYCNTSARNDLINNKGWTINGDAIIPSSITPPDNITIIANQGACEAIDVELGNPVAQSCLNFEVENNAPEVFPLGTTQVTWTLTDENGQIISAQQNVTVTLEVDNASLCYVTSDEEQTTKNRIFINNFGGDNVLQYDILREVSTNNFQLIGSIEDPNENSFLDETSNNLSQSYAYRIRTISICNTQDNNLITHQTVLLQSSVAVNNSVNLNWSSYNGLNYDVYNIYRKVDNGSFELLATVSSSTQSYNDVSANVNTNTYEYYISISAPDCSDSQSQDKMSFSSTEIKSNILNTSNLNVLTHTADLGVSIYPNPSSNEINIAINDAIPFLKAEIFDLSGKLVLSSKKKSILIKDLPSSSYIIKIYTQQGNVSKVFIKK